MAQLVVERSRMRRQFHGPAVTDACNPQVDVILAVWDADECAADVMEIFARLQTA